MKGPFNFRHLIITWLQIKFPTLIVKYNRLLAFCRKHFPINYRFLHFKWRYKVLIWLLLILYFTYSHYNYLHKIDAFSSFVSLCAGLHKCRVYYMYIPISLLSSLAWLPRFTRYLPVDIIKFILVYVYFHCIWVVIFYLPFFTGLS